MKAKYLKYAALIGVLACLSVYCVQVSSRSKEPKNQTSTTEARGSRQQRLLEVKSSERASAKLPLQFEENKGQADPNVRFISRSGGYTLFLTENEAVVVVNNTKPLATEHSAGNLRSQGTSKRTDFGTSVVKMKLVGGNSASQSTGKNQLVGTSNYFIGRDAHQWHTGIPTYSAVEYKEVYPGIDLVYYGNHRQLEYDFVLSPGADPRNIALSFAGTSRPAIDRLGNLSIETAAGRFTLAQPSVYQMVGKEERSVRGRYVLRPNETVGFELGSYDVSKSLTIDPVLAYSTYLGGSGNDSATDVKADAEGNVYIAGETTSVDFPSTSTSISTPHSGHCIGFVTKLDSSGTVLYSSYLGGTAGDAACYNGDHPNSVAVDASGQAYVAGVTVSQDFPVLNALQPSLGTGASSNAFLSKLSSDGGSLLYSTYLGGWNNDGAYVVAVDSDQNAYVGGWASSSTFPVTTSAYQTTLKSSTVWGNGFITRIDTTTSGTESLVYSSFLGGTSNLGDTITGIAIDASHNAYLTGWTGSADFPITPDTAFQPTAVIQNWCGFVSRIDTSQSGSSSLLYSSFLCGTYSDWGWRIALGPGSDAFVTGFAGSADFPTTVGGPNSLYGKAYVARVNTNLSGTPSKVYARLLGGDMTLGPVQNVANNGNAIAVDPSGNAYVGGWTTSPDFPLSATPLQSTLKSSSGNGFLTVLNPDGTSPLLYSTYFGGSGTSWGDSVYGVSLDSASNVYIVGVTDSSDLPTTSGTLHGPSDAFAAKLTLPGLSALSIPLITSLAPTAGTAGSVVTISGSGFGTATGSVKIGGIPAAIESWAANSIVVQVPSLLNAGLAQVAVTTVTQTSNSEPFSVEAVIISKLFRTFGPAGAKVRIFGSGFGPSQGSSRVAFNGVAASVTSWSESSIEVLVPRNATTGNVVVTVGTTSSNPVIFRVVKRGFDKDCTRAKGRDRNCDPKLHFLNRRPLQ